MRVVKPNLFRSNPIPSRIQTQEEMADENAWKPKWDQLFLKFQNCDCFENAKLELSIVSNLFNQFAHYQISYLPRVAFWNQVDKCYFVDWDSFSVFIFEEDSKIYYQLSNSEQLFLNPENLIKFILTK